MAEGELLRLFTPVARAITQLLGPYVEVVLHDAARDRVLGLWNPMSTRAVGDPSLLGELDQLEPSGAGVFGPYEKILADGRRLTSVSALLDTGGGEAAAVVCINFDRSPLDQAAALLATIAAPAFPRPEAMFAQDWSDHIEQVIGSYVRHHGRTIQRLTREDRLAILDELEGARVFAVRRSVPTVANSLECSRSTIYSLLAEVRSSRSTR